MNVILFPWADVRDPWYRAYVPSPPPEAPATQLTAFGAVVGLVHANSRDGHLYGKLGPQIKQTAVAYMKKYGPEDWKEPGA